MGIYNDKAFISLIAWAKAILIENEQSELTSDAVLSAVPLSIEVANILPASITESVKLINKNNKFKIPEIYTKTEKTFPISNELQFLIKKCNNDLTTLIELIVRGQNGVIKNAQHIDIILAYASTISIFLRKRNISTKIFTVAAYYAFLNGEFSNSKLLSDYVLQYVEELKAIASFYRLPDTINVDINQQIIEQSDKLKKNILSIDENFTLIGVLNQGLEFGKSIIEELWAAYHEAGHAVTIQVLADKSYGLDFISIVAKKGEYDGVVQPESTSPYISMGSSTIERKYAGIIVYLAGYTSQKIKFGLGKVDTGASGGEGSDIYKANRLAWLMISEFGQDRDFGPISLNALSEFENYSIGYLNDQAQIRFQKLMKDLADQTEQILKQNWDKVEALVEVLLKSKIVKSDQFSEIFSITDLTRLEHVIIAESRPVERTVAFVETGGIIKTPEGYVKYQKDDVIVTDGDHSWPISKGYFLEHYEKKEPTESEFLYIKKPTKVKAVQLMATRRLDLFEGKGLLFGNKGDWLVDYGGSHQSIVSKQEFERLYKILEVIEESTQHI